MGGQPRKEPKIKSTQPTIYTVNINKIASCDLDPNAIGKTNSVYASIVRNGFRCTPVRALLDTGATFSVISQFQLRRWSQEGLQYNIVRTTRNHPVSASNHELKIFGDVVLDVQIKTDDGELKIKGIRFTVLEELNCPLIIGIEVLGPLKLKIDGESVMLLNRRVPLCDVDVCLRMEVIDSIVIEETNQTIVSLKGLDLSSLGSTHGTYLLSAILPNYTSDVSVDSEHIVFDPQHINATELQSSIDIQINEQLFEVPKVIEARLSPLIDNITMDTSDVIHSLQDRTEFIDNDIVGKLVEDSHFAGRDKEKLRKLLLDYKYVFSASDFDVGKYDEKISLELSDPEPVYVKSRRIPYELRKHANDAVKQMCEKEIIVETDGSHFNSPILLVKKPKSNKYRFCTDFRKLNAKLKQNRFPLPLVKDLLEQLGNSNYFSALDMKHGFYNVQLDKKSQDYTAFTVGGKQYKYLRLPMGLSISPAVFQRIMSHILKDLIGKGVLIYLDDVLLYSPSVVEHLALIKEVFVAFAAAGILLNPAKCCFALTELNYLGYTLSNVGYKPQANKVKAISEFPQPTNKKACKRFLGMMGFYSDLIPTIQYTMGPLHEICGSKSEFVWTDNQERAFLRAKELLVNSSYLSFPSNSDDGKLILSTDACETGYGACLTELLHGCEQPIGFTSGRFRNSQLNWTIAEKEAYAFVEGLNFFYTYLYGRYFIFRTDNRSLSFLNSSDFSKKPSGAPNYKRIRWMEFISQFSFTVELRPGTSPEMHTADCLSRAFENDTVSPIFSLKEIKLAKPFWIKYSMAQTEYLTAQSDDQDLKNLEGDWSYLIKRGSKPIYKDGLLYLTAKGGIKLAVPKTLETKIFDHFHLPLHLSQKRMESEIRERYIFPRLRTKLQSYISSCGMCVSIKQKPKPSSRQVVTGTPYHPWMCLQLDLVGPLDKSLSGNVYILTVVDCFTRWAELRPLKDRTAMSVAEKLLEIMYVRGPPVNIQMDNARELQSELLTDFLQDIGIYSNKICPYHPQSNGLVESLNKRIKQQLLIFKSEGISWDSDLPAIQLALNLQKLDELKTSPFEMLHGWLLCPSSFVSDCYDENEISNELQSKSEWSKIVSIKMARAISDHYITDQLVKTKRTAVKEDQDKSLQIGTRCLRLYKQPPGTCAKLFTPWKGVFKIRKQIDVDTYLIALEDDPRKKFIVHRRHLRPLGTYYDAPTGAEKEIEAENVNGEAHSATREASREPSDPPTDESMESGLRRSERLKNKSTNFKQYFNSLFEG